MSRKTTTSRHRLLAIPACSKPVWFPSSMAILYCYFLICLFHVQSTNANISKGRSSVSLFGFGIRPAWLSLSRSRPIQFLSNGSVTYDKHYHQTSSSVLAIASQQKEEEEDEELEARCAVKMDLLLKRMRGGANPAAASVAKSSKVEDEEEDEAEEDEEEEEDVEQGEGNVGVELVEEDDDDDDDDEEDVVESVAPSAVVPDDSNNKNNNNQHKNQASLDPKLSAAAIASSFKAKVKVQASKASQVKKALNAQLAQDQEEEDADAALLQKNKKSKSQPKQATTRRYRKKLLPSLPYILRACLNPFTAFSMVKAYWVSLFNLDYPPKEPSQELRSALEAKGRGSNARGGGNDKRPPKRKMKPGQAKTLSDLPQLST